MSETRWRAAATAAAIAGVTLATAGCWWWWRRQGTRPFLDGRKKKMKLIKKERESHDTLRLVFELENKQQLLGAYPGTHIIFYGPNRNGEVEGLWNNKADKEAGVTEIRRPFSPISPTDRKGEVEVLVKVYAAGNKEFVDGGKFSQYLGGIEIGDEVLVSGPAEKIRYTGPGRFQLGKKIVEKKKVGLLAGGTGIAPVFLLIRTILENERDDTRISLIYANKTQWDILLKEELEEFASSHPDQFKLWYTLDSAPADWEYSVGYINADMIKEHIFPPAEDVLVFCCGPKPMVRDACKANLRDLGYDADDVATF